MSGPVFQGQPGALPSAPGLLESEAMADSGLVPGWVTRAFAQYRQALLDEEFPCYFGTAAERRGDMQYSWADDRTAAGIEHLPGVVRSFLDVVRIDRRRRRVLAIVMPGDRESTLAADERRFWRLLDFLHSQDARGWPEQVPRDPDLPGWEYCFDGEPMFAFACSPHYQRRFSRRMGAAFLLCFQPRSIFSGIEGWSRAGQRARQLILERARAYDAVPPHPGIANMAYGDPAMREWRQYMLPDENTPLLAQCPFRPHDKQPEASVGGVAAEAAERED